MAFKATRNMPFSLILQKLVVVLGYLWNLQCCAISLLLFWKCFLLICLQLWTLPTFFKIKKRLENKKNAKKVKKRYQNKKTQKNVFFTSMSTSTATCRCARTSNSPRHSASPRYTSDPSLCAVGHTSDARACTGALPAGLWERRAGRPSGLPDASTPVGPERGGSTDLPPDDPRPHIWCSHQSALVAGSGTKSVQAGCSDVRDSACTWRCATLPRSTESCRRLAWSTNTPFYQCQPPRGTSRQTQQSAAEPLRLRLHTSGIHCQLTSLRHARCPPSVDC